MTDPAATASYLDPCAIHDQLVQDCAAMAKYSLSSGIEVPADALQLLADECDSEEAPKGVDLAVRRLGKIHSRLAALVDPATPKSIRYTQASQGSFFRAKGSTQLLRWLVYTALTSLALFIVMGAVAFPDWFASLAIQLQYVAAAALGASFFSLYKANDFVTRSTFDPRHESTYWVRIGLGVIAGTILANFVNIDISEATSETFEKATVAMLGGFSADVVKRILNRLVETLESLVKGNASDLIASREQSMKVKMAEQLGQRRLEMAGKLANLQQRIGKDVNSDQLRQQLQTMVSDLIGSEQDTSVYKPEDEPKDQPKDEPKDQPKDEPKDQPKN